MAEIITLLLDAAKGWLPVVLVKLLGPAYGLQDGTVAMVGLAAFLGHLYPVFFRFVGGKGVATALGVLLGVSGWLGLISALIWVAVALVFRYSSLASIGTALLTPVVYVLGDGMLWFASKSVVLGIGVMALLLLYRHAANINRLIKGTESKLGKKQAPEPAPKPAPKPGHRHGHAHRAKPPTGHGK